MATMKYPRKVVLGEITARDGLQHEEKTISTNAKLWILEQLILAGFKRVEVTNLGTPKGMPQFADADQLLKAIHDSRLVKDKLKDVELTAVTIREKAADRAIEARKEGWGPPAFSSWSRPVNPTTGAIPAFLWKSIGRCVKST